MKNVITAAAIVTIVGAAGVASARNALQIAGSSTVLPYAKIVQNEFMEAFFDTKVVVEYGDSSLGKKEESEGVCLRFIDANKTGVGVFGLAFYENNKDKLVVAKVDGVVPAVFVAG